MPGRLRHGADGDAGVRLHVLTERAARREGRSVAQPVVPVARAADGMMRFRGRAMALPLIGIPGQNVASALNGDAVPP